MQTPPEIEFQGMAATPGIEDAIAKHVAELEQRWGRITACRVVLKGPGQHHRKADFTRSIFVSRFLTAARSMWKGRRQRTNAIPI